MIYLDRFLNRDEFNHIYNYYSSSNCPWYYNNQVNQYMNNNFYFTQKLYDEQQWHLEHAEKHVTDLLKGLSKHLDSPLELLRAKANCFVNRNKHYHCGFHKDMIDTEDYYTFVYNINDNNGGTQIKDGEFYKSEANSGLLFYGGIEHESVTQTDTYIRLNINVNFRKSK